MKHQPKILRITLQMHTKYINACQETLSLIVFLLSIGPYQIFDNWLLASLLALVPDRFMDPDKFILLLSRA